MVIRKELMSFFDMTPFTVSLELVDDKYIYGVQSFLTMAAFTLIQWTPALHHRPLVITSSAVRSRQKTSGLQADFVPEQDSIKEFALSQFQSDKQIDPHQLGYWWNTILSAFMCILWPSDKLTTHYTARPVL